MYQTQVSSKARDLDLARRNVNSRASMTSNVSYIRFSDHDLFDDNVTDISNNGSFRTQTVGTKTGKLEVSEHLARMVLSIN